MSLTVTLKVSKEGRYWVGMPDGYPGSCMGRSVMELVQEAQAILPFMTAGQDGAPSPDVTIDYVFTDVRAAGESTPQRVVSLPRRGRGAATPRRAGC